MDIIKLYETLKENVGGKHFWLLGVSLILAVISPFAPDLHIEDQLVRQDILTFLLSFMAAMMMILFICLRNRIPKSPKDKIGILIVIKSQSKSQYREIEAKFTDNINNVLFSSVDTEFEVISIDYRLTKKYNLTNINDIHKLLGRSRCAYYIYIKCVEGLSKGASVYNLNMHYAVRHRKLEHRVAEKFRQEFNLTVSSLSDIFVDKTNDIEEFKICAIDVALACKYIIGTSAYLSLDFKAANNVLIELNRYIESQSVSRSFVNYLKTAVPKRIGELNLLYFDLLNNNFFINLTDRPSIIIEMRNSLVLANRYYPNRYEYYLGKASLDILDQRNVYEAKIAIGNAKKINTNKFWMFSEAFLSLYEGKSIITSFRKYIKALRINYDYFSLIRYIEYIFHEDVDKMQFSLALAMLYNKVNDSQKASFYAELFLEWMISNQTENQQIENYVKSIVK